MFVFKSEQKKKKNINFMLLDVSCSQWVLGRGLSSETKEQLSPLTSLVSLSETESKSEISTLIPQTRKNWVNMERHLVENR